MITCPRRLQYCHGHRIKGHENKCAHLHGHNYVTYFEARAGNLDAVGRVVDFGVLKERIGAWVDDNWDHGMVLWEQDEAAIEACRSFATESGAGQKLFLLPTNPTAENLADYLLRTVCPEVLGDTGIQVVRVQVWETENCYAVADLD